MSETDRGVSWRRHVPSNAGDREARRRTRSRPGSAARRSGVACPGGRPRPPARSRSPAPSRPSRCSAAGWSCRARSRPRRRSTSADQSRPRDRTPDRDPAAACSCGIPGLPGRHSLRRTSRLISELKLGEGHSIFRGRSAYVNEAVAPEAHGSENGSAERLSPLSHARSTGLGRWFVAGYGVLTPLVAGVGLVESVVRVLPLQPEAQARRFRAGARLAAPRGRADAARRRGTAADRPIRGGSESSHRICLCEG